tara:strand:+ start:672 stop:1037 length:366 start_codon:yes stop_codon:yes gene_type:complete
MAGNTVVVIGAGLSGLRAADLLLLRNSAKRVVVLEARDRVGGRLYRVDDINSHGQVVSMDLGGQWIGPTQKYAMELVKDLDLKMVDQYDQGSGFLRVCFLSAGRKIIYVAFIEFVFQEKKY